MAKTILSYPDEPYIYMYVMGRWYCYDPSSKPLGKGAMGTVYMGYRVEDAKPVAVKRVVDEYADIAMIRTRAKQEASLAFRHPNLIEMIGYCEYEPDRGPLFLLSNYVKGMNIDDFLNKQREDLRFTLACEAICKILDALEYIHSRGVIHRDIKPSNIMMENGGNVRLMDLGIARMNDSGTKAGFIGTLQYAAPEQLLRGKGSQVQINATTDIYALGVTFYELLTGTNPYDVGSDMEIWNRQLTEMLPHDSRIPKKLMRVIWKATEKQQASRFQKAADFKAALNAALQPRHTWLSKITAYINS